ncbi:MAG: prepilin-type N-terminal cleavage/methylation domain-containing protein [Comamonas sp.]|jgi:general secretion pathway protein J|uniref:prepilin-type N-terminal cleavage/methylation domain-containing protein n=1 Tax=Comamonas sp. TaxID=34028 RepID=UPI002FC74D08
MVFCTPAKSASKQQGFTLLELLIAMSLLTLLMLGLGSTLLTVAQTQSRVEGRLTQIEQQRVAVGFLRTLFGKVSSQKDRNASVTPSGKMQTFFKGEASAVQWLGIMPSRFGVGGRTHFRLGLQLNVQTSANDLVLWYMPWESDRKFLDFSQATAYVLEKNVQSLKFGYQNDRAPGEQWREQWLEEGELPSAIELSVETITGHWRKTIIAVFGTASSVRAGAGGEAVFGGTAP